MSNQILWDCHMHSSFSADSDTSMEDMIREAICRGLTASVLQSIWILITHLHRIMKYLSWILMDTERLSLDSEKNIRRNYRFISVLSLVFNHIWTVIFTSFWKPCRLISLIGSSHIVHGYDPYYKEYFKGREESACYREYFESILENLHAFSEMDVYGHIDYIVRYGPNQNKYYTYERYQDILDEILRTVIARGRGIELNTGGFHYGLGEPNPCRAVIRRYRELGGEIITVGADAHGPEKIAYDFDKAAAILADCGFKYYTVFQNRKPEFVKL